MFPHPTVDSCAPDRAGVPSKEATSFDGSTRWRVLDDLWINRQAEARVAPDRRARVGATGKSG